MKFGCPLPLNALFIRPDGEISPCCVFYDVDKPKSINISNPNVFNDKYLENLRDKCKKDEAHPGCTRCYQEEKIANKSYRTDVLEPSVQDHLGTISLREHTDPYISFLDIAFSNLCNNKCRMCGPSLSTNWYTDAKKLEQMASKKDKSFPFDTYKGVVNNNFLDKGDFSRVQHIKFLGGEPLLEQDKMISLIEKCDTKNLTIHLVTNATTIPNNKLIGILKQCKSVSIALSVDSYGKMNDFLRKGSTWKNTTATIEWFNKNFDQLSIQSVASIYNVNIVDRLMDYCITNKFDHRYSLISGPNYMQIRNLPDQAKNSLKKKINNWLLKNKYKPYKVFFKLLQNEINQTGDIRKFHYMDSIMNKIRNEHWRALNPELYKWISSGS